MYGFDGFEIQSCVMSHETYGNEECESISGFLAAHSSCLLTHAFLIACERVAAGYLSLGLKDPSKKTQKKLHKRDKKLEDFIDLEEEINSETNLNKTEDSSKTNKKKKIRSPILRIEGKPFLLFGEGIAWTALFVAMLGVFVLQYVKPTAITVLGLEKSDFKVLWIVILALYLSYTVGHAILTTRDG